MTMVARTAAESIVQKLKARNDKIDAAAEEQMIAEWTLICQSIIDEVRKATISATSSPSGGAVTFTGIQ